MNKKTWQQFWEFTDEDMARIETLLNIFKGKIIKIDDNKKELDKEQS